MVKTDSSDHSGTFGTFGKFLGRAVQSNWERNKTLPPFFYYSNLQRHLSDETHVIFLGEAAGNHIIDRQIVLKCATWFRSQAKQNENFSLISLKYTPLEARQVNTQKAENNAGIIAET
ncbi:hypothetical protein TNCV_221231 [Trichonephila clavipes]|nr:hypothetical protein TNCV_221231 [Trichonephila clavipes]